MLATSAAGTFYIERRVRFPVLSQHNAFGVFLWQSACT
jgi:hypothetical protein